MFTYDIILRIIKIVAIMTICFLTNYTLSKKKDKSVWQKGRLWYLVIFYGLMTVIYLALAIMMAMLLFKGFDWIVLACGLAFLAMSIFTILQYVKCQKALKMSKQ